MAACDICRRPVVSVACEKCHKRKINVFACSYHCFKIHWAKHMVPIPTKREIGNLLHVLAHGVQSLLDKSLR